MARKSPKDSAAQRDSMQSIIKMSSDEMINRARREALEGIRRLAPKPSGYAPGELWPGESLDLGGFTIAKGKRKKSNGMEGMA